MRDWTATIAETQTVISTVHGVTQQIQRKDTTIAMIFDLANFLMSVDYLALNPKNALDELLAAAYLNHTPGLGK